MQLHVSATLDYSAVDSFFFFALLVDRTETADSGGKLFRVKFSCRTSQRFLQVILWYLHYIILQGTDSTTYLLEMSLNKLC